MEPATDEVVSSCPVDLATFDYRRFSDLDAAYRWAGSFSRLSAAIREAGRFVAPSTLQKWHSPERAHPPEGARTSGGERQLAALREYFESRTVPVVPGPTVARRPGAYATALVMSDLHYPYVHRGAFECVLGLAETLQPEEIVIAGDTFDFAQIGRYVRDPRVERPIQEDIDLCREQVLARIAAAAPNATRRFIVGNHECSRWDNYLFTRCPELASLRCLTMENVLGLAEMGWHWQPYEFWLTDQLIVFHGDRHTNTLGGGSAMSARKEMLDMGCSGLTGHTHRAGAFLRQDRTGYRVWYEIGCLCDWRQMQAAHLTHKRTPVKTEDWHLACAVVRYRDSAFHVDLLPILTSSTRTWLIWGDEEIAA